MQQDVPVEGVEQQEDSVLVTGLLLSLLFCKIGISESCFSIIMFVSIIDGEAKKMMH